MVGVAALLAGPGRIRAAAPPASETPEVVVLRTSGIFAYSEVAEGLKDSLRVLVAIPPLSPNQDPAVAPAPQGLDEELRRQLRAARLVVAVGQSTLDRVYALQLPGPLLYAMAPLPPAPERGPGASYGHRPGMLGGVNSAASADELFRALLELRRVRRIGAVYSPRTASAMARAQAAAQARGIQLVLHPASTGPEALQALRALVEQDRPDALWLGADPALITTPVFQYALMVQLRRNLPVLALTRQQVRAGALLALDSTPQDIVKRLALLCQRALSEDRPMLAVEEALRRPYIKEQTARRLSLWPPPAHFEVE